MDSDEENYDDISDVSEDDIIEKNQQGNEDSEIESDGENGDGSETDAPTKKDLKEQGKKEIIKPHLRDNKDFSKTVLPSGLDTEDQAPLVVVVQGSQKVFKYIYLEDR